MKAHHVKLRKFVRSVTELVHTSYSVSLTPLHHRQAYLQRSNESKEIIDDSHARSLQRTRFVNRY